MDSESAIRLGVDISRMLNVITTDWRSTYDLCNFDGDEICDDQSDTLRKAQPTLMQGFVVSHV